MLSPDQTEADTVLPKLQAKLSVNWIYQLCIVTIMSSLSIKLNLKNRYVTV